MTPDDVGRSAATVALDVFGVCHTLPEDGLDGGTLVLLGPKEPGYWRFIQESPEWRDGHGDPVDRWSMRVIGDLADALGAQALFPFGKTLYPFMSWAIRSGRAWSSPVQLLVHDVAGLMVSYRGALLFPGEWPLEAPQPSPCETCASRPCGTACPVGALRTGAYDLDTCHEFLNTEPGATCMSKGCAVRRSCPVTQTYGRVDAQSGYHMERFHR